MWVALNSGSQIGEPESQLVFVENNPSKLTPYGLRFAQAPYKLFLLSVF